METKSLLETINSCRMTWLHSPQDSRRTRTSFLVKELECFTLSIPRPSFDSTPIQLRPSAILAVLLLGTYIAISTALTTRGNIPEFLRSSPCTSSFRYYCVCFFFKHFKFMILFRSKGSCELQDLYGF